MANERPNRLGGFSTGSTKLTFMLFCGYHQAENRKAIEMIVDKTRVSELVALVVRFLITGDLKLKHLLFGCQNGGIYGCLFALCYRAHPVTGEPCGPNVHAEDGTTPRWVRGDVEDEVFWRSWELAEKDVELFEECKRNFGEAVAWDRLRGKIINRILS